MYPHYRLSPSPSINARAAYQKTWTGPIERQTPTIRGVSGPGFETRGGEFGRTTRDSGLCFSSTYAARVRFAVCPLQDGRPRMSRGDACYDRFERFCSFLLRAWILIELFSPSRVRAICVRAHTGCMEGGMKSPAGDAFFSAIRDTLDGGDAFGCLTAV